MTTPFLEFIVNGLFLVLGNIVEDVHSLFLGLFQGGVDFVCDHFVYAALEREEFTLLKGSKHGAGVLESVN